MTFLRYFGHFLAEVHRHKTQSIRWAGATVPELPLLGLSFLFAVSEHARRVETAVRVVCDGPAVHSHC